MTRLKPIEFVTHRLPSKQDSFLVFSACVFPIHFWLTLVFLYNLSALVIKANIWQTLGVFAYVFSFALIESLFLFSFLVLLSVILPGRIFGDRFVYLGTSLAIILSGLALLINTPQIMERYWIIIPIILITITYIIYIVLRPLEKVQTSSVAERLTVISSIYLFIDVICFIYILIRQII